MFELPRFIADLRRAATEPDPAAAIRRMMAAALAEPAAVAAGLPDGPEDEVLLHADDAVTLYDVRLAPGMLYPAHEHGMAAVIGLYRGREVNVFYRETAAGTVDEAARREVGAGEVLPLGRDVIHAVANPDATRSGALHAYLGDLTRVDRRLWPAPDSAAVPFTEAAYFAASQPFEGTAR